MSGLSINYPNRRPHHHRNAPLSGTTKPKKENIVVITGLLTSEPVFLTKYQPINICSSKGVMFQWKGRRLLKPLLLRRIN